MYVHGENVHVFHFQHTDAGAEGGGQPLASPGSCIEKFKPVPFVECVGQGRCNLFSTASSYWLATVQEHTQFSRPEQQTLKAGSHESRISRCSVCARRRPDTPPEVPDYEVPDIPGVGEFG